jgi:alkylated DNA repair dioxygenase AlkB
MCEPFNQYLPSGLYYIPNFISEEEIQYIQNFLNDNEDKFKPIYGRNTRKVLQYGYQYNYRKNTDTQLNKLDEIPDFLSKLINKNMTYYGVGCDEHNIYNQLIINKYEHKQCISKHIDDTKYFGPVICCLTIGCSTDIVFTYQNKKEIINVDVGSLYIMSGDSRYKWYHQTKTNNDKNLARYSLTFRTVI